MRPPGKIATFYSYKGGTGRSMALANFAWALAASGKRVVAVDWDLEAPGLHRYFRPFLSDCDLVETDGLIDAFWRFAASAMIGTTSKESPSLAPTQSESIAEALEDSTRRLNQEFVTKGYIDFICAGRQGATYSERVNTFDWKRFYDLDGAKMVLAARDYLRSRYDWVLIDSRTGVSDTSGICTIQLPDLVVACFTMNRQSVEGVAAILRSIRAYRTPTTDGSKIAFYPLATRIENNESRRLEVARHYARDLMQEYLPNTSRFDSRTYWDKMEISYRPSYAFEEVLAAFGDASGAKGAADTMLTQMEGMAQTIAVNPELRIPEVLEDDRVRVLESYAFDGLPLVLSKPQSLATDPAHARDNEFRRLVIAKEQLWRAEEFSWRYLLSRRELELVTDSDQVQFGREVNMFITQSRRAHALFNRMDRTFYLVFVLVFLILGSGLAALALGVPSYKYFEPMLSAALIVPLVMLTLAGAMLSLGDNVPYGLSTRNIIGLIFAGPLRGNIRDLIKDAEALRGKS